MHTPERPLGRWQHTKPDHQLVQGMLLRCLSHVAWQGSANQERCPGGCLAESIRCQLPTDAHVAPPSCPTPCVCSGIGALFNIICLVLCFIFPAKSRAASAKGEATEGNSGSSGVFGRFRKSSRNGPISNAAAMDSKDVEAEPAGQI